MSSKRLSKLIKVAVLSAMAFIIMFIEIPLPLFPEFLKIDLSDIPALLGAFSMGPIAGVAVEVIKNVLHFILNGKTAGVGELANVTVGAVYAFTAGIIYKRKKSRKNAILSLGIGVIVMSVVASVLNYYVFLPLYETVLNFPIAAIVATGAKLNSSITNLNTFVVYSILPFNIIKGIVESIVIFLVYKKISPILHK